MIIMKNFIISALRCRENCFASPSLMLSFFGKFVLVFVAVIVMNGCKKGLNEPVSCSPTPGSNELASVNNRSMDTDEKFQDNHKRINWRTMRELLLARAATAKYTNIKNAINDGYADIKVDVPNMGHHYMKNSLADGNFEIRKPEILVYNKMKDGRFRLVAVEYAVPINLSPNKAPEGFTGKSDVWDRNEGFGLWLLHAWVWHYNPDGVFNPTNPLIHLH